MTIIDDIKSNVVIPCGQGCCYFPLELVLRNGELLWCEYDVHGDPWYKNVGAHCKVILECKEPQVIHEENVAIYPLNIQELYHALIKYGHIDLTVEELTNILSDICGNV